MNTDSMANFICELRKSKNLTQKQLAEKPNITDKAISKWERGGGYPDINILLPLAEILGVTTNELLNGKKDNSPTPKADIIVQNTLDYVEKVVVFKYKKFRTITEWIIYTSFIISIIVCMICDIAVYKGLTWSLYPITSIIFTWLIIIPLFRSNRNRILLSLISLSVFIIPFLFILELIIGGVKWFLPLGLPVTICSLIYLWSVWFLYTKTKLDKWYASGVNFILTIPLTLFINLLCSHFTGKIYLDFWNGLSIASLATIAIILISIGRFSKEKLHRT